MQAPIEVSHGEQAEVFFLDILSHRMSAMGIFHQLSTKAEFSCSIPASTMHHEDDSSDHARLDAPVRIEG